MGDVSVRSDATRPPGRSGHGRALALRRAVSREALIELDAEVEAVLDDWLGRMRVEDEKELL